jgi:hypothetical protein
MGDILTQLDRDGALRFPDSLSAEELADIAALSDDSPGRPGRRISGDMRLTRLASSQGAMGRIAAGILGPAARAVRAVLFDKTPVNNWPLGWHQDRTIVVTERAEVPGYGPFTCKAGLTHVQPPAALLAGMVTLRAHLDACDEDNAPLKVAPGTHRFGMIPEDRIEAIVARAGILECLAAPGDVWAYRTLILHASDVSRRPRRRRVLQVDFAAEDLPQPLRWAGI